MSVTFTTGQFVEDTVIGETVLMHGTRCDHTRTADCCEDAAIYHGWCDHADADEVAHGCKALDVNVSNANAAAVLARLGYEFDPSGPCGDATAEDFLGRCMVGNVGQDDSGYAATQEGGPGTGRATVIECGVRPGYFASTLARLARLATAAGDQDLLVVWA